MQRLTTKEPNEKQLEVAIVAVKCALGEEYFPDFDPTPYLENAKKKDETEEPKEDDASNDDIASSNESQTEENT